MDFIVKSPFYSTDEYNEQRTTTAVKSIYSYDGVINAILFARSSANQRLPSGPGVMPKGALGELGVGNSVIVPLVVMRPTFFPWNSANQRLPSGPAVMSKGSQFKVGTRNSVKVPFRVMRPILFPKNSVNQRLPSDPVMMKYG